MSERLPLRDVVLGFAANEPLQAALFLTYAFDGRWFEEALVPDLCERPIETFLVVRDRNAISSEAPSVRYLRANAGESTVFHPKLILLVAEDRARAIIGSANLTRSGFERQQELARVYDMTPDHLADRDIFRALFDYLKDGVSKELKGDSRQALLAGSEALRHVIRRCRGSSKPSPHVLLHNYADSIWDQLLRRLPHRVLRRAVIVSPFFEADRERPEDPTGDAEDGSIFGRLVKDFTFGEEKEGASIRVFFRANEGRTELPVRKIRTLQQPIGLYLQNEQERRLHGKLLLLEGDGRQGRQPFCVAVHGSPNFTAPGMLRLPPSGNAELAVLTSLPSKREALDRCVQALGLDQGFTHLKDFRALHTLARAPAPMRSPQGAADVTYRVREGVLRVVLRQVAPPGSRVSVLISSDGAWVSIGECISADNAELFIPTVGLAFRDERTQILELQASCVRIDVLSGDGTQIASDLLPLNVDMPQEFCGTSMVGDALLRLDERLARAGLGHPPTYREQQKWLEARRAGDRAVEDPVRPAYQADLDRFFRNVHHGLRGISARVKSSTGSIFSLHRAIDDLTRWSAEACQDGVAELSRECRLFLIDRLLSTAHAILERCAEPLKKQMIARVGELQLKERLQITSEWLDKLNESTLAQYASSARTKLQELLSMLVAEAPL